MQLKKGETNYYFAIPLQKIVIEKYQINISELIQKCQF